MADEKVKREPVDFDYTGLNWEFIKLMAMIPPYASEKYGAWQQYSYARLEGEKSPENHIVEHLRSYMLGEPYDKFDGDVGRHLVAIAYNAMMAWYYLKKFGHVPHPLKLDANGSLIGQPVPQRAQPGEVEAALLRQLKDGEGGVVPVNTLGKMVDGKFVAAPLVTQETDWAEGLSHFNQRWRDGLDAARDPGSIRRWTAMVWVLSQFSEVARTDEVIFGVIADIKTAALAAMQALKTPENIEEQQAKIAALDTLRSKIPGMFQMKAVAK